MTQRFFIDGHEITGYGDASKFTLDAPVMVTPIPHGIVVTKDIGGDPTSPTTDLRMLRKTAEAAPVDPWVVVGRTTIDGVGVESFAKYDSQIFPDRARSDVPHPVVEIGGQHVRGLGSSHRGDNSWVIRCEIVKRRSECCAYCEAGNVEAAGLCGECLERTRADLDDGPPLTKPRCPECGPHGNDGRVLLAERVVACTVCAGGVSGDAFGVVNEARSVQFTGYEKVAAARSIKTNINFIDRAREQLRSVSGFAMSVPAEYQNVIAKRIREDIDSRCLQWADSNNAAIFYRQFKWSGS